MISEKHALITGEVLRMTISAKGKQHFDGFLQYRANRPKCRSLRLSQYYLTRCGEQGTYFSDVVGKLLRYGP